MKKIVGLAVFVLGLLTLPCAAYTEMMWTDILITPSSPSSFFAGVVGGDGAGSIGIDWGIGNTVPFQSITNDMVFSTCTGDYMTVSNWKERMRITKDGNVGIGTANPTAKLSVNGAVKASDWFMTYGTNDWQGFYSYVYNSSYFSGVFGSSRARGSDSFLQPVSSGDSLCWFVARGYDGSSFQYSSDVAIAFQASEDFDTSSHGTYMTFWTTANGSHSKTEKMRITDSGNVGIGTTNPLEKLEVDGNVLADQFLTGDIIFRKDGKPVWRMYEDEKGLYVQSLTTEKKYILVLEEMGDTKVAKADGQDINAEIQVLQAKNSALEARLAKLEALLSRGD